MDMLVPFDMIAAHEAQAQSNHSQTLDRLNERGGLSPSEFLAVLEDRPFRPVDNRRAWELIHTKKINWLESHKINEY